MRIPLAATTATHAALPPRGVRTFSETFRDNPGDITDVMIAPTGDVIAISSSDLQLYSREGKLLASGRRSPGSPEEMRDRLKRAAARGEPFPSVRVPGAVAVDGVGRVYVSYPDSLIIPFSRRGNVLAHDTSFAFGVEPLLIRDLCTIGERLYAHGTGLSMDGLVQILDRNGKRKDVFGKLYRSGTPYIDVEVNEGVIACDDTAGVVAYAPRQVVGEVRAFRADGKPLWRIEFDGFKPARMTAHSNGGHSVAVPEGGFHRVESLVFMPPDRFVIQIASLGRNPIKSMTTILLRSRDGTVVGTWELKERIVAASANTVITTNRFQH
jgi:hypothetical protein